MLCGTDLCLTRVAKIVRVARVAKLCKSQLFKLLRLKLIAPQIDHLLKGNESNRGIWILLVGGAKGSSLIRSKLREEQYRLIRMGTP